MQYVVTIYNDESQRAHASASEGAAMMEAYGEFTEEARAAGVMLGGEGLQPTATATTLRVQDGERLLTDGPFAETKEQIGGYYTIDCKDLDEAIDWAAKIPGAQTGSVEVRPVIDYEALSAGAPADGAAAAS
jgi:hypothetical protein